MSIGLRTRSGINRLRPGPLPLADMAPLRAIVTPVLILLAVSCGSDRDRETSLWTEADGQKRSITAERWDTLWTAGSGAGDSVLLNPRLLAASDSGLFVWDDGGHQVLAYGLDGRLRWRVGRKGSGPEEFKNVRDLKVMPDGGLLLLDPANSRVSRVGADGQVEGGVPLRGVGHAEQLGALPDGRVLLLTMDPQRPFVVVDSTGGIAARPAIPWRGYDALDPLARQGLIAGSGDGRRWVFGFGIGNGWFAFDGTEPRGFSGRYVEHTPFPVLEKKAEGNTVTTEMTGYNSCSGCSLSLSGDTMYVHFGGYSRDSKALLDRYDVNGGKYLGSYRLPFRADAVAVGPDRIYALVNDPYPAILALRPRPGGQTAGR